MTMANASPGNDMRVCGLSNIGFEGRHANASTFSMSRAFASGIRCDARGPIDRVAIRNVLCSGRGTAVALRVGGSNRDIFGRDGRLRTIPNVSAAISLICDAVGWGTAVFGGRMFSLLRLGKFCCLYREWSFSLVVWGWRE